MASKPVKMGAKETGETWRDFYITPHRIEAAVRNVLPNYFDPCPVNPTFDGLTMPRYVQGPIDPPLIIQPELYVNPPFSEYQKWVDRWLGESVDPRVQQLWLCHTNNSSRWFKELTAKASAICLFYERIKFIDPRTMQPTKQTAYGKSQAMIYVGRDVDKFTSIFQDGAELGTVWRRVI